MANPEGDNIRRQYFLKILPPKLAAITKDVPTPSEFLLGNNLNDKIGTIETSQKLLQTLLTIKIQKACKDFQKSLEIKTRGTAASKPEVTTTTKNNDRGINNHNNTRETELH